MYIDHSVHVSVYYVLTAKLCGTFSSRTCIGILGLILWCTKRVKSTDTGRPVFQKYGSTRKNTGRPVNLRVDPYFRYGSTRIFAGRPVNIRVDPYFYGSTRIIRVDPYFCGSTRIFTGRPVFYGSTCIYGSTRNIRVDPYFTGRPVS